MKKRRNIVFCQLLSITIAFVLLASVTARGAADNTDAKVQKLEASVKAIQAELDALKPGLEPKDITLKFGGRIYNDWAWMSEDSDVRASSIGDLEDGTEFRTARLYVSGTIYDNVDYKGQYDFSTSSNSFKDVYIGISDFPVGYLKMGHFKEPFGLEELTSSRFVTFMERSLANTFSPGRNTGVALSSTMSDKRATWAAGLFRNAGNGGGDQSEGSYNVTGRVTVLPLYENEGAKLLHIGAAYSLRNPESSVQYATEPEAHLAPDFVDTTSLSAEQAGVLGLETALVCGPFSVQGEYMMADVDGKNGSSSPDFDGYYVQGSYFLTGENRKYKTSSGAFDRVKPRENYSQKGGCGAWEVAARYSQIDLNDGSVTGGKLEDVTVGLNWYLNPNTRIMWNYIRADLDRTGDSNLFMMRLQVDF
jgi:phosphate-selective porin OprO/OprP